MINCALKVFLTPQNVSVMLKYSENPHTISEKMNMYEQWWYSSL